MTPKDKAEELLNKYYDEVPYYGQGNDQKHQEAKLCALICVDEIINLPVYFQDYEHGQKDESHLEFWQEVKSEIEKL